MFDLFVQTVVKWTWWVDLKLFVQFGFGFVEAEYRWFYFYFASLRCRSSVLDKIQNKYVSGAQSS